MSEEENLSEKVTTSNQVQNRPPPTSPSTVRLDAVLIVLDDWLHDRLRNTPVSHNTQIWNHVAQAVAELKSRLQGLAR